MKKKPIIFSSPMVKAILEDKKDMTRRVVKGPPCTDINGSVNIKGFWFIPKRDKDHAFDSVAPYCVGDILWVRETWGIANKANGFRIVYKIPQFSNPFPNGFPRELLLYGRWRPSIFLPRYAARIFLEVKHVHLEQVQSISERDAVREGVTTLSFVLPDEKTKLKPKGGTFRTEFKYLWDKLNKKRGYGWDKNPWVWVIQFDRIKK
jgi:hypothetical protein